MYCKVLVGCVVHFTFLLLHYCVYHRRTRFYLINNSMKPNRITQSLFRFVPFAWVCWALLFSADLCALCAVQCIVQCIDETNARNVKRKRNTYNNSMKANKRQSQFFFSGFFIIVMFLFFSLARRFVFIWNWLLRLFFSIPFSMHHSLHQGKGMTIARIQCMQN